MKTHLYGCCLLAVTFAGCAAQEAEQVEVVSQLARVKDHQGQEQVVSARELYAEGSSQPRYESVWVVDRKRKRRLFVSLKQLEGQTQADARYILATVSADGGGEAAER